MIGSDPESRLVVAVRIFEIWPKNTPLATLGFQKPGVATLSIVAKDLHHTEVGR